MIERSRVRIPAETAGEFSSAWSTFSADSYFWCLFHPRVTAAAQKRSRSFCQKCDGRLQLNTHARHVAYVASDAWLHGVHRTCTETAAASRGTGRVTTKQRCKYTTFSMDTQNALCIAAVTHSGSRPHVTRPQCIHVT